MRTVRSEREIRTRDGRPAAGRGEGGGGRPRPRGRGAGLIAGRAGLAGLAAAGLLASCGQAKAAGASGTATASTSAKVIRFHLWESHSGGPVAATVTKMVQQFDATHPAVQVSIKVTGASKRALAAWEIGHPPLLAEISHAAVPKYLTAHALVSFNKFIDGPNGFTKAEQAEFFPGVWSDSEIKGQHWRFIADVKVSVLYYNPELFARAGIRSLPRNWAEFASDLGRLKKLGVIPAGWKDSNAQIWPIIESNGGTYFRPGSHETYPGWDTTAVASTLREWRALYKAGDIVFSHPSNMRADFVNDKMAIVDGTSAGYVKELDAVGNRFPLKVLPFLPGTTGHAANIVQGLGFVIFRDHTAAQENAAWTFVKWWNEPRQQAYWAMHSGFAPTTKAAIADFPKGWLASHPGMQVSIDELESPYSKPRPNNPNWSEVDTLIEHAWFRALTGAESVPAVMAHVEKEGHLYLTGQAEL